MAHDAYSDVEMKNRFIDATQHKYIPIAVAGEGKSGKVWYAIQKNLIEHPVGATQLTALRAQVCAVKVYAPDNARKNMKSESPFIKYVISRFNLENEIEYESSSHEIAALLQLKRCSGSLSHRFPQLIEALTQKEAGPGNSSWFSMGAIRGFQLSELTRFAHCLRNTPLPEALVYHIFVQLMEALEFLHKAGISKSDIQELNVMVDMANSDVSGLPNIMFIDFAGSKLGITDWKCSTDRAYYYILMHRIATKDHACLPGALEAQGARLQADICRAHDKSWTEFVGALRKHKLNAVSDAEMATDGDLRPGGRLFAMAKARRLCPDGFNHRVIETLLNETLKRADVKDVQFPSEEEVLEAIVLHCNERD
ncbi:hypothetical protein P280DRAFT_477181 [Massarina eburnea CBS 473.64]|uniref:Protein kinase domain-containing protein n=1 Tax=Massarina eburnea CBS 473.64 TaxID=1395130 RepID=A0A6A6SC22_9PLEO|nr:hypothetical protein P280DRAFT_477181 [Massarina eburnea CBS 473.64]